MSLVDDATRVDDVDTFRRLLQIATDAEVMEGLQAQKDFDSSYSLIDYLVKFEASRCLKYLLKEKPNLLQSFNLHGLSALASACKHHQREVAIVLLEAGAAVQSEKGKSHPVVSKNITYVLLWPGISAPLISAVSAGFDDVVQMVLTKGADIFNYNPHTHSRKMKPFFFLRIIISRQTLVRSYCPADSRNAKSSSSSMCSSCPRPTRAS